MSKPIDLTLAQAAVALNELYLSLVEGGFTEEQALYLVGRLLVEGKPPTDEERG